MQDRELANWQHLMDEFNLVNTSGVLAPLILFWLMLFWLMLFCCLCCFG